MADFSKQWADIYDPKMPWDFDIETEIETRRNNHVIFSRLGIYRNRR